MGGADIVPGVSGGTVALILGIYERLINSIRSIASAVVALLRGDRHGAGDHLRRTEFRLIVPLGIGIVGALAAGTLLLLPLIETYPVQTNAVFLGLVAGALPVPWQRMGRVTPQLFGIAALAALVAFVLTGLPADDAVDPSYGRVFASAAVAICAMILPGVSGSFLLVALGMYEVTLTALRGLDFAYIAVFVTGAVTGLGAFSKLLSWLLDRRHDATMAALVGLMAGSLRALWPWQGEDRGLQAPPVDGSVVIVVLLVVAGVAAVTALTRFGARTPLVAEFEG